MTMTVARLYLAVLFVAPFAVLVYDINTALLPFFLIAALLILIGYWLLAKI